MVTQRRYVQPQPGPQEAFLASTADIVIYGGAAGGGKTFGLLMEDLYEVANPAFGSVTFRRTYPMITNVGGLWPESFKVYGPLGAVPREDPLGWTWPSGAVSRFSHLQHESDMFAWQGAQIPVIKFDELTHFSMSQFFYMLTRNRNTAGIHSRLRATCNADADHWVAEFIKWWWHPETGYPIPERAGVVRYFARDGDEIIWADDPLDLPRIVYDGEIVPPKSATFIPAKLSDNPELLAADPGYVAALLSADLVTKERLIGGNWLIRYQAGTMFRREWFTEFIDREPDGLGEVFRYWDTAATPIEVDGKIAIAPPPGEKAGKDPDWTIGVKMARKGNRTIVLDVVRARVSSGDVEAIVKATALADGRRVKIRMEQEPGASGKAVISHFRRNVVPGFNFEGVSSSGTKIVRAKPFSAECQTGTVVMVRGPWNTPYIGTLCAFPTKDVHDDDVDASSGAYNCLTRAKGGFVSW